MMKSIVRRWRRLVRARRLRWSLGDPLAHLQRLCDELEMRLTEGRERVTASRAEMTRLAALRQDAALRMRRLHDLARQAVRVGQEELAREAVTGSLKARRMVSHYARLWDQQRQGVVRMQRLLDELEMHFLELDHRRQLLVARRELIQTQRALLISLDEEPSEPPLYRLEHELLLDESYLDAQQQLEFDDPGSIADAFSVTTAHVEAVLDELRQAESGVTAPTLPAGNEGVI